MRLALDFLRTEFPSELVLTLTANRTEKRRLRRGTGLETVVDMTAMTILIFGALAATALLFTFTAWGTFGSVAAIAAASLHWLLLRCVAEHLRLQKKIAGLDFEGQITGPYEEIIWSCTNCEQMLHSAERCDSCGAQIVHDGNSVH